MSVASDNSGPTPTALRALVDETRDGIVVVGPDGCIEFANTHASALVGLTPDDVTGTPFHGFFVPEHRDRVVKCLGGATVGREILEVLRLTYGEGPAEDVEIRARRMEDGRTLAVLRSVSELRRYQHALQIVSVALAEASSREFFDDLVLALTRALSIDFAFIGELLEPACGRVRLLGLAGPDGIMEGQTYDVARTPCEVTFSEGRRFFTGDAQGDFPRDEMLVELGVRTYYGVPLFDDAGACVGILGILRKDSSELDGLVVSMLDLVASRVSAELLRLRVERQRERTERLMQALMRTSSRFVWGVDATGEPTLDAEGAWNEATGLRPEAHARNEWIDAVVPEERDRVWSAWRAAFEGQHDLDMEYAVATPAGIRHLHVRGMPIHDDREVFEGFIGTIDDITDAKRSAEELRRRNDVLRMLRAVPEATHNGAGFLESVQVALTELCRTAPFEVGRLRMQGRKDGPFEYTGLECGKRSPGASEPGVPAPLAGRGELPPTVTASEGPVWIATDHPDVAAAADGEVGPGTAAYVGVRFDGEVVAILELFTERRLDPDETWMEVLSQMGIQLSRTYERDRSQLMMREAERKAREAQKLEAVGRLSAGIAHDFNNLLMVVLGEAELALRTPGVSSAIHSALQEILTSGRRAAALTAQLLAFSRRQIESPETVDLAELVRDADRMLRRLVGENVELDSRDAALAEGCFVEIGRGLMEQVVMNLVVNAREAMPAGGTIRLALEAREVDEEQTAATVAAEPGPYVVLSVSDTGVGIPESIRDSIFEPFFTTKEDGSGFGLSTSYGIVSSAGGFIEFDSEVGAGTEFRIFLPLTDADGLAADTAATEPVKAEASRTVLIVEDDDGVRSVAIRILEAAGYRVLAARDGRQVEDRLDSHPTPPDVLLTDCVLERETGRDIDQLVRERYPGVATVFMSGYTDDVLVRQGMGADGREFLPKPFSPDALVEAVERVYAEVREQPSWSSPTDAGSHSSRNDPPS